jgi:glycosyltransferase involved in cell wall biosynthesis
MKILLVHNYYQHRGGEDVVFEQERDLLRREGHEVAEYRRSNDELHQLTLLGKVATAKTTVWASDSHRDLSTLLKRAKYDLVHVHNTFVQISPSIYWACREARVPVVQTLHNYRLFCPSANFVRESHVCRECVERGVWRAVRHGCFHASRPATATVALMLLIHRWCHTWTACVDRYIALSNFARDQFVSAGLPAEKIAIKPNFVDPDPGYRTETRDYAVYLGRLSEEKGVETLLTAFKRLHERVPLVIIGDGPLRAILQARADSEGLSASLQFRGWLGRQEAIALLKGARFLLMPSQCYETFGIAVAEAYACGVPVIASALGSIGEIVDNGHTGLCFRPGDSAELAEKIAWAWDHPEIMAAMGQAARARYEAQYTAARNYTMLMDIYRAAIGAREAVLPKPTHSRPLVAHS